MAYSIRSQLKLQEKVQTKEEKLLDPISNPKHLKASENIKSSEQPKDDQIQSTVKSPLKFQRHHPRLEVKRLP